MDIWGFAVDMTVAMKRAWELENPLVQEQDIRNSISQPDEDESSSPPDPEPPACRLCVEIAKEGFGPSHNGSPNCQSGSIASGGMVAHCTCDTCF